ncbi:uncharacterized protein N7482_002493 [Penicillium canariense]|uniref:Uncharacterized protein n=1 Tax=Penicillium canariense TaxID=189055 RepID=A0A9W9LU24_9EURO|nr:uncharacterized protein N7482_002493 [Penicillium canariense]KAJ5176616.1 hypothetical protein N7482_002493 [Penicillium canariense]
MELNNLHTSLHPPTIPLSSLQCLLPHTLSSFINTYPSLAFIMPTWFRKGIERGTIITLDQPGRSRWQILEKLNENDFQLWEAEYNRGERFSLGVTKLRCRDLRDHKEAFMRIYLQVPYRGTEMDDADTRAKQATTLQPRELLAYEDLTWHDLGFTPKLLGSKTSTQDKWGPVPGGYAVYLVWEKVPGVRLGTKDGSNVFWALDHAEREEIRLQFVKNFHALEAIGYQNDTPALSSLVWDKDSKTLYFIGFRHRNKAAGPPRGIVPDEKWIAYYELAKPNSDAWLKEGWNQDTTEWKW